MGKQTPYIFERARTFLLERTVFLSKIMLWMFIHITSVKKFLIRVLIVSYPPTTRRFRGRQVARCESSALVTATSTPTSRLSMLSYSQSSNLCSSSISFKHLGSISMNRNLPILRWICTPSHHWPSSFFTWGFLRPASHQLSIHRPILMLIDSQENATFGQENRMVNGGNDTKFTEDDL